MDELKALKQELGLFQIQMLERWNKDQARLEKLEEGLKASGLLHGSLAKTLTKLLKTIATMEEKTDKKFKLLLKK